MRAVKGSWEDALLERLKASNLAPDVGRASSVQVTSTVCFAFRTGAQAEGGELLEDSKRYFARRLATVSMVADCKCFGREMPRV